MTMCPDRLFVLQVVIAIEQQWFAPGTIGPPVRTEKAYGIDEMIFAAADEEAAFHTANEWLDNDGFSDANHDGEGDITRIYAVGIHQIEEIGRLREVVERTHQLYGVDLPGFTLSDVDSQGVPFVRQKEQLEIFRLLRIKNGSR